jgi:hypothetical protein
MIHKKVQDEIVRLVDEERNAWEDALVQITPTATMYMRQAIQVFRKNYQGMFTKKEQNERDVWIPVTEQAVEDSVKMIDLDQKDINFRAVNKEALPTSSIVRAVVKNRLDHKFFGQDLDQALRSLAIDGTVVWKVWRGENEFGKDDVMYRQVDLLNLYIDPHADTIQATPAIIERVILPVDDVKNDPDMVNTEDIEGTDGIAKDGMYGSKTTSKAKEVELFERWGLMPKYFLTGNKKDTEMVQGRIVISGRGANSKLHLVAENDKGLKPYEEVWYTRVPGQWYGRGVAQKVLGMQLWANMVKNIHITRQKLTQLGVLKVRKGSGITPQMIRGLTVSGVVEVEKMDDLQQLVIQEASQSSYRDMDDIQRITQAVTSTFGAVSPENLPASMPATTAVLNDRNNKSAITLIREGVGFWLQRLMDRHIVPIILDTTSKKDIVHIMGDDEHMQDMIDRVVAKRTMEKLKTMGSNIPDEMTLRREMDRAKREMSKKDILLEIRTKFNPKNYEMRPTKSFITNEEMDTAVTIQNMISMLNLVPEAKNEIVKDIYDLLGLDAPRLEVQQQQQPQQPVQPQAVEKASSGVQQSIEANTNVGGVV